MIPDPNCNCDQCEYYRNQNKKANKVKEQDRYISCEHLKERFSRAEGPGWDPEWLSIKLSKDEIVVLCEMCRKSLSYDILVQYNKNSQIFQPYRVGGFR